MRSFLLFLKNEIVLTAATVLAIVSAFLIHPDKEYLGYVDFRTLALLFCLMAVMGGFQRLGFFRKIAQGLLKKVGTDSVRVILVLVLLAFFFSMLITNDVGLITFVPFTFTVLELLGEETRNRLVIPVVVLETLGANLGSMMTPIGNPQNLYLYGLTGMGLGQFILTMLPYTLISAVLLALGLLLIPGREKSLSAGKDSVITSHFGSKRQIIIYAGLFVIALLSVVRVLPWYVFAIIVLVVVGGMDYKILFRADYILLLTFIGFFIFTGNMGNIEAISSFLGNVLNGREFAVSVALSQVISNVPATLMLSGFTTKYKALLLGVNIGGLGTLIASMASLISYKAYSKEYKDKSGKYMLVFTCVNVAFLIVLVVAKMILFR